MASASTFEPGDKILFRKDGSPAWFEGKVEGQGTDGSYRVKKLLGEPTIHTATYVRVMPEEKSMQDKLMEAMLKAPEPDDPYSHLYMMNDDIIEQEPGIFDNLEGVEQAEARPDGSHSLRLEGGRRVTTATVSMPDNMYGVDADMWMMFSGHVENTCRRKLSDSHGAMLNVKRLAQSILPSERSLVDLQEAAQSDPVKMLQLADATDIGLYGWPQDRSKAMTYYMCAAWGCSEARLSETSDQDAYPAGSPEALCAAASSFYDLLCTQFGNVPFNVVIRGARNDPRMMGALNRIVMFLAHAIRREWVCPFALALGQALQEEQLLDPFIPHVLHLMNALECRKQEMERLQGTSGELNPETMRLFEPKATEIFLGMPAPLMTPSGLVRNEWHVEYREMPFPPYPIMVLVVNPGSRYLHMIKIPDEFEYCPYSREAFQQIWARLVLFFHLGDGQGNNRQRPAILSLVNKPGDSAFAAFVRNQIGDNSGTDVRLVTHDRTIIGFQNRRERLGDIVEDTEKSIVDQMKNTISWNPNDIRTPSEQMSTPFQNRHSMSLQAVLTRAAELKEEGNGYYTRGRMMPARKSYSEAIELVRASTSQNDETYQILGTLLSNRSACVLKMTETMNPESAVSILKTAIMDCQIALESSWSGAVLPRVRQKLQRRKEVLIDRSARLAARIHRIEDDIMNEPEALEVNTGGAGGSTIQRPSAQRAPSARRRRRRGQTRRQRQSRRRRQRQARVSHQQQEESTTITNDTEQEEETIDAESIELPSDMLVQLGRDLLESKITSNVSEKDDICPCCTERFRVELENRHAVVLSCSHACCLPCLGSLKRASERQRDAVPFTCPICRFTIQSDCLDQIARFIVADTDALQDRLNQLPLSAHERGDMAQHLLIHHGFVVGKVLASLDSMMADNLQSSLWRVEDLTPEEKQKIYEEARRPVDILREELRQEESRLDQIRDQESEEYIQCLRRTEALQDQIAVANQNAQDEIYSRINSTSSMGRVSESGDVQIDFHALHVDEARAKFDELVLPILPPLGHLLLIVGRGRRSEGGVAKLKPALKRHIENHSKRRWIRWEDVQDNAGVLRVLWRRGN